MIQIVQYLLTYIIRSKVQSRKVDKKLFCVPENSGNCRSNLDSSSVVACLVGPPESIGTFGPRFALPPYRIWGIKNRNVDNLNMNIVIFIAPLESKF